MTTSAVPLAAYNVASQLLTCAADRVTEAWAENPDVTLSRECVVWGAIAWDDCECGQLVVSIAEQYPSNSFPTAATAPTPAGVTQGKCGARWWVVRYVVSITRCMPVQDGNGNPPTCEALDQAAQIAAIDSWAVRTGIACCLIGLKTDRLENGWTEIEDYQITGQPSVGPQGGCGGSDLGVLVAIRNCFCPDVES